MDEMLGAVRVPGQSRLGDITVKTRLRNIQTGSVVHWRHPDQGLSCMRGIGLGTSGMSLFAELKRRNVFRMGGAYLALGWVVTQVTATVAPALGMPEWTLKLVVWLGIIGFPLIVAFAWAYELTPEGIRRESELPPSTDIRHASAPTPRLHHHRHDRRGPAVLRGALASLHRPASLHNRQPSMRSPVGRTSGPSRCCRSSTSAVILRRPTSPMASPRT